MDRRKQLIREQKNSIKNALKGEGNKSYRFLIASMILGVTNWVFWHDQFIGLDLRYNLFFIVLPLVLGVFLYYSMNKLFIKDIFGTKASSWWDRIVSNIFMVVIALFFAYFSIVTLANVAFKISMDYCIKDQPIVTKNYTVTLTYRNDKGRGFHMFSSVYYLDENNETKIFNVGVEDVEDSHVKRKITFKCQQGFWGYYKILDYELQ